MVLSLIIDLSHALALKVIVEGVETTEQLAQLRDLECHTVQGNYFSKPLPSEIAGVLLATYIHH